MTKNQQTPNRDCELIIGIGDLHGNFPALEAILGGLSAKYQIFEDAKKLKLREGVEIVTMGDYIDRNRRGRRIIETLMSLGNSNPNRFCALMGNHEHIAISELACARKVLEYPEGQMEEVYRNGTIHGSNGGMDFVKEFGMTPREAFENYTLNMSTDEKIGSWMRTLNPFVIREIKGKKVLFVHAGIPSDIRDCKELENLATRWSAHMRLDESTTDKMRSKYNSPQFKEDAVGLLWNRDFIQSCRYVSAKNEAKKLGVDHIVAGHTLTLNLDGEGIANYGGEVFDIDVGMVDIFEEPAAIVFKRNGVYAFYVDKGEQELVKYNANK